MANQGLEEEFEDTIVTLANGRRVSLAEARKTNELVQCRGMDEMPTTAPAREVKVSFPIPGRRDYHNEYAQGAYEHFCIP